MIMDLSCDTFMERYLTTLDSPFLRYFFLKLRPESKVTVTLNDIRHSVTPKTCTQTKVGIPISNNLGFMLVHDFLDLMAYVKVGYARLRDPKMHEFT